MVTLEEAAGIVALRFGPPYGEGDEAAYLNALSRVAAREGSFAMLAVFAGRGRLSAAGERAQALWFKATRSRMGERCQALAIVRPGPPGRSAEVFGRLWTFPVLVDEDEAVARAFLARHVGAAE